MLNTIVLTLDKPHFEVLPPAGFSPSGKGFCSIVRSIGAASSPAYRILPTASPGALLLGEALSGVQP
jgi:hypothetical protein